LDLQERATAIRRHDGATLVIVALSLIAIFAVVTLTVDVGGLLLKRRELVAGSDAAALAAAQSCASSDDSSDPEAMADAYAAANVGGLTADDGGIIALEGCDTPTGYVTVEYQQEQELFFGPAIGLSDTGTVRTQATAAWAPLGGGNLVPIMLQKGTLQGLCGIPDTETGTPCAFWWNNDDLGDAEWGWLSLRLYPPGGWNVPRDYSHCTSEEDTLRARWIQEGGYVTLAGDPPGSEPTYVCRVPGHTTFDWAVLKGEEGETKLFPVNDCTLQVDRDGNYVPCGETPNKFAIVGFTYLTILHVYKGNDPLAVGTAGASGSGCEKREVNWPASPPSTSLDLDSVLAGTPNTNNNCPASAPDNISFASVHVRPRTGSTEFVKCPPTGGIGCQYLYDESTHVITWVDGAQSRTKVQFDWWFNGTAGACGSRPPDPNAICIETVFEGYVPSPELIGGGDPFGAEGIRLCDLAIPGSCPGH
jgi:hypothetical protein